MPQFDIASSIVLYKNDPGILEKTIGSFFNTELNVKLYLIDNSPDDKLKVLVNDPRIEYIFNNTNAGFGKAHNIVMKQTIHIAKYHLVLNPDVYFMKGTLDSLFEYMEENEGVGLVMPKVLSFENELQYLCKRLPGPTELILRRFLPKSWSKRRMDRYEMRDKDYNSTFSAPSLSGCFMFVRSAALRKVGLFDERYFMYLEDIDLSRRIFEFFDNVYFPKLTIYHGHAKESYKSFRLLKIHVVSAIKYFGKWGWFFDVKKKDINGKL